MTDVIVSEDGEELINNRMLSLEEETVLTQKGTLPSICASSKTKTAVSRQWVEVGVGGETPADIRIQHPLRQRTREIPVPPRRADALRAVERMRSCDRL